MKVLLLGDNEGKLKDGFMVRNVNVVQTVEKLFFLDFQSINPDRIISYNYRHIISDQILNSVEKPMINLHISYLPWNRGADPNPWSHLEDTPKGVTIHRIDCGIDTGPILIQKEIQMNHRMTLRESYNLLNFEIQEMFWVIWAKLDFYMANAKKQDQVGTFHALKDRDRFYGCLGTKGWDVPISEFKKNYEYLKKENKNAIL